MEGGPQVGVQPTGRQPIHGEPEQDKAGQRAEAGATEPHADHAVLDHVVAGEPEEAAESWHEALEQLAMHVVEEAVAPVRGRHVAGAELDPIAVGVREEEAHEAARVEAQCAPALFEGTADLAPGPCQQVGFAARDVRDLGHDLAGLFSMVHAGSSSRWSSEVRRRWGAARSASVGTRISSSRPNAVSRTPRLTSTRQTPLSGTP
jgi:hypothetical protein